MYYVVTWKENDNHLTKIEELRSFSTWKKANRYYQKKRRAFAEKWSWINGLHNPRWGYEEYAPGGCDKEGDGPFVRRNTLGTRTWGPDGGIDLVTEKALLEYL